MNKLHLVWGEHTDFILKTFKSQRDCELHCDISIVSNDGYVVRGHQAILAAASGWFMQALLTYKHDHPTIVLENVSFHYLKALLNYIYVGSVQVDQTEMNRLLEIADSLQLKGLGRLKDNSAMSKFLSNTNNISKDSSENERTTDNSCSKTSNTQTEKDSTSNTTSCAGGILFEDTPDISEEEPVSDSEKQITTSDPSMNYSVENESNAPTVEERFFPCSSSIGGDSILSSSQMHSDDSNNIHSSSFQGPSSVCYSQPAYVAKSHSIIHQSHFNQPSHLYNPCVPKREYEIRMSAPSRTSMLDYLNSNGGQQSSVGDFRIQNKMAKLPSQQELLYEHSSNQTDNNAVHLQDSANASQHCLNSIQHQLGTNSSQHHRHYTSQFLSSSPQVLPNYSSDCSSIPVSSSVLTMHQPGGYSYDYSVGNIATSSSQSDTIQQPNTLLPTSSASLYQTAGIDLSLTKNEPASPTYTDDKRKRPLVNLEQQDGELLPDGGDSASRPDDEASKKSKLEHALSSHSNTGKSNSSNQFSDLGEQNPWIENEDPLSKKRIEEHNTSLSVASKANSEVDLSDINVELSAKEVEESHLVDGTQINVGDEVVEGLGSNVLDSSNSNDVDILTGDGDCIGDLNKDAFSSELRTSEKGKMADTSKDHMSESSKNGVKVDGPDGQVMISVVKENPEEVSLSHKKLDISMSTECKKVQFSSKKLVDVKISFDNSDDNNDSKTTKDCVTMKKFTKSRNLEKRLKKQAKLKRLEARRKWLAQEKRTLFSGLDCTRPLTRALQKLYSIQASKNDIEMRKTSENNDSLNVDTVEFINVSMPDSKCNIKVETKNKVGEAVNSDDNDFDSIVNSEQDNNISICIDEDNILDTPPSQMKTNNKENKFNDFHKKVPSLSPKTLYTLPPLRSKEKQSRVTLTLQDKVKVIEAFLDGKSHRQIALMYGIGKTQVSGIVKKREEILSLYKSNVMRGDKLTSKRIRKSEYASLNEHLIKWYRHMSPTTRITTGMIRAKALQIAPQLGYHDFKASNGWFATFKSNNDLKFTRNRTNSNRNMERNNTLGMTTEADNDTSYFDDADVETNETEGEEESNNQILQGPDDNGGGEISNSIAGPPGTSIPLRGSSGLTGVGASIHGPSGVAGSDASTGHCAGGFLTSPGLLQGAAAAILKCGVSVAGQSGGPNLTPQLPMEAFHLSRPTAMDHNTGGHPHHHPVHHSSSSLALAAAGKGASPGVLGYKSEDAPLGYGGYEHHHQLPTGSASRMADQLPHRMADPSQLTPRMSADQLSGRGMVGDQLAGRMGEGGGSSSVVTAASSSAAAAAVAAAARTSEYNYAPYTFPSGYYGYHFLGQY